MQKNITVDNNKITYTLSHSRRARRMRLAVHSDGSVVVTTPFFVGESMVEKLIREKSQWLLAKIKYFTQLPDRKIVRQTKADYEKHKEDARQLVFDRLEYYSQQYKFPFNRVSIRNQKTRWGSCSIKGNLNFNYKVLFLEKRVQDYIIVHELCHLKEFNHSRQFWNLVAQTIPGWKAIRRELKNNVLIVT